jgi:hypothetical protein
MRQVLEGLKIISKYTPEKSFFAAAHDEIWAACIPPEDMSPNDVVRMDELGWSYEVPRRAWRKYV